MQNVQAVAAEYAAARAAGNFDIAAVIAGEAVGLIHDIPPAAEIVDRIVTEAEPDIERAAKFLRRLNCSPLHYQASRTMWPDRRIIDLFKTEFPIVLAPMAGIMDAELVIAAAQGGALGSLPCAMITAEKAREQVNIIRQRVSAPVNMNFFCHTPVDADPAREAGWKTRLGAYYEELGIDPAAPVSAANRAPFDEAMCALVEELKPEVVELPFRPAASGAGQARQGGRLHRDVVGDDREGSDLAGGERRRRHHRARRGGGRPSRHVPDRQYRPAARHVRAGAAGGRCGEGAGDRGRRHRRRARHRGGVCARRIRRQIGSAYLRCPESKVIAAARAALAQATR